ncbi:hypothetical protein GHK78_19430 [Sinorhizobium meliloti]|uniref:hypothetical protein n=1 Tax=Rhizobium meliloti TaxID=382 RepID=UPI001294E266|nr:hypothetical protein [Sinorhizobium meliloti]MQX65148.1 hypothetical protein [Sinorhizobium meliloti]
MDACHLRKALEDMRPKDKLAATVAHWHETPKANSDTSLTACSYGIALAVNRRVRWILWGTGYAPDPIPPVVLGIDNLLKAVPEGRWLEINALIDLYRYLKPGGIGRYAMDHGGRTKSGTELGCYPTIGDLIAASDARRWSLCPHAKMQDAPGYGPAIAVARGRAKTAALQHKSESAPTRETYPKPVIVGEHIDVFP